MDIMKSWLTKPRLKHQPDVYKHQIHQEKFEINALVAYSRKRGTNNYYKGELQQFSIKKMWYI